MKKWLVILWVFVSVSMVSAIASAQCAMCTKTAQQLGEKPAAGLNSGILYLMLMPFAIVGFIAFRWWKGRDLSTDEEQQIS